MAAGEFRIRRGPLEHAGSRPDRMKRRTRSGRRGRLLFLFRLGCLGLSHRLCPALNRRQPAGREGIDSRSRALRKSDDRQTIAALIPGNVDAVGCADAADHVAFGMSERDVAGNVRSGSRSSIRRRRIGIRRCARRSHSGTCAVGADEIFRRHWLVRCERRRFDRDVLDEKPVAAREPLGVLREQIGREIIRSRRATAR